MISRRSRRLARVLPARSLRAARRHCLSLLSAGVLAVLAFLALSSDTFQSRSSGAPQHAGRLEAAQTHSSDAVQQMMVALAWTPPDGTYNPDQIAAWFQETWERLTPLERARLRPRIARPAGGVPFAVNLPDTNEMEKAEALLTAIKDAELFGLNLTITDAARD